MNLDDTIVAVSSPPGAAWRGIVRLSGADSIPIADGPFRVDGCHGGGLAAIEGNCHVQGMLAVGGGVLPSSAYLFRAPHSYTRQDIVEIHVLGSPGVLGLIVEACLARGARRAEPGEFTARAYLAGAFDLSQVHAIAGMIAARSDHQLQAAERLLHGALGRIAREAREELGELLSLVEGALDFADEPIEFITLGELRERLTALRKTLASSAAAGLRAERWGRLPHVLLSGKPNVGKSSLLNRLTGLDRAICASVAGTTRDVLSAPMTVGETECLLLDVAGVDEGASGLARAAQAAARRAADETDAVVYVIDATVGRGEDRPWEDRFGDRPVIVAVNKCDLVSSSRRHEMIATFSASGDVAVCPTSAVTGTGCDAIKEEIHKALHGRSVDVHESAIAMMAEHREALEEAAEAVRNAEAVAADGDEHLDNGELVAAELRAAARAVGTLVGEEATEDILGRIFSRFCVGK